MQYLNTTGRSDKMTSKELKSIRQSLNLSKTDFAKSIGIAPVLEGKYEKGTIEIPESVIQAVNKLKNTLENEPVPAIEEDISVIDETSEIAPAAEKDQSVSVISTVREEDTLAVSNGPDEEKPKKQERNKKEAVDATDLLPAAIPFFVAPIFMTNCLFTTGLIFRPRMKIGFFGPCL